MNDTMKIWMKEHFANMADGAIWMPEGAVSLIRRETVRRCP